MKVDPQMNLWLLLKFPWSLYWSGQTEWKDPNSAEATRENLKTQTHRITPNVIYYDGRLSNELYCEGTDWETPGFTTNHWLTVINHVWRHQRLLELNTWIKITSEPNWSQSQLRNSVLSHWITQRPFVVSGCGRTVWQPTECSYTESSDGGDVCIFTETQPVVIVLNRVMALLSCPLHCPPGSVFRLVRRWMMFP